MCMIYGVQCSLSTPTRSQKVSPLEKCMLPYTLLPCQQWKLTLSSLLCKMFFVLSSVVSYGILPRTQLQANEFLG